MIKIFKLKVSLVGNGKKKYLGKEFMYLDQIITHIGVKMPHNFWKQFGTQYEKPRSHW